MTAINEEIIKLRYQNSMQQITGYFAIHPFEGVIEADLENGIYKDVLSERNIVVKNNKLVFNGEPVIIIN